MATCLSSWIQCWHNIWKLKSVPFTTIRTKEETGYPLIGYRELSAPTQVQGACEDRSIQPCEGQCTRTISLTGTSLLLDMDIQAGFSISWGRAVVSMSLICCV